MSRFRPWQLLAFAAIPLMAVCGGGDDGPGPVEPPPPQPNRAPQAVGSLGTVTLPLRGDVSVDVSSNFRDPDGDALTISATSSDPGIAGAQTDGPNVTVTGVAPGTATITVTARDTGGLTATQQLGVTVNGPPVLTDSIPDHILAEGATATVNLDDHFTDPDNDVTSYEAESSDAAVATVSVEGATATITGVSAGSATVTFTVRDDFGQEGSQDIDVTVEDANQAPQATDSIPAQALMPDATATIDLSAHFTDPDDDALTYEGATSDAAVATVIIEGSNATITGVAAGTATITFTASDPEGLSATQDAAVTVNTPPAPEGTIDDITVTLGGSTTLVVSGYFTDADGDDLSYEAASSDDDIATASAADSTVTINGVGGGMATITITATDPRGRSAEQEAKVRVNRPPGLADDTIPVPTHDMVRGNAVELDIAAYFADPDGDPLTFTATTSRGDLATATVEGSVVTTTAAARDTTAPLHDSLMLTVTATDPWGLTVEQQALVRVNRMDYDTIAGITVDSVGVLKGSFGETQIELTLCIPLNNFPFGDNLITMHWSEWQRKSGTGWVAAQSTHFEGQVCPVKNWPDRPAGIYRMVGRMTTTPTGTTNSTTQTLRTPTFENKLDSDAANDASFSSLESGQLDAAQPSRASFRSPVLPGTRFRPPPTAEARAASRVAQVRAGVHATLRPPAFTRSRGFAYRQRASPANLRKTT